MLDKPVLKYFDGECWIKASDISDAFNYEIDLTNEGIALAATEYHGYGNMDQYHSLMSMIESVKTLKRLYRPFQDAMLSFLLHDIHHNEEEHTEEDKQPQKPSIEVETHTEEPAPVEVPITVDQIDAIEKKEIERQIETYFEKTAEPKEDPKEEPKKEEVHEVKVELRKPKEAKSVLKSLGITPHGEHDKKEHEPLPVPESAAGQKMFDLETLREIVTLYNANWTNIAIADHVKAEKVQVNRVIYLVRHGQVK